MQKWHDSSFEEREQQIKRHGKMQDEQHKDVFQFVTGSSGLDDAEWGVTLFAHDLFNIKDAVQEMRADFLSVKFMEFGDFYIGLSLPLDELFRRVQI
jgi:chlorite dismutase